jgi:ribonucleoside-diphosphate reductase alpha chain
MEAVLKNAEWKLKHPTSGKILKKIKARYLWDLITENAWQTGDPGLVFIDTINKTNPTPSIGIITCTNPCGEVPLLPYEACNLGSIDVSKFFEKKSKKINWQDLEKTIEISVRFLDNVIEMNDYLLPEINTLVKGNRKIGLGIMGWANLLILLEIPYASAKAITLAKKLMKFINIKSAKASSGLAKERGVFKNWEKSIYCPNTPMRNATRTSIAPTGTISIIANTSSSVEPLFALVTRRENVLNNETLTETNDLFIQYLKSKDLYSKKITNHILQFGTIADTQLPKKVKQLFKTALEIEPEWHLKHQIAFQEYTDNAVSKTINLPQEATVKNISDAYIQAWKQKVKGITVFRNNSKQKQVLHQGIQTESASCKVCRE